MAVYRVKVASASVPGASVEGDWIADTPAAASPQAGRADAPPPFLPPNLERK